MNKMKDVMKRGALIIFEGCDRSGKTTQCKRQVERLTEKFGLQNNDQPSSIGMRFPDRTTEIGKAINETFAGSNCMLWEIRIWFV